MATAALSISLTDESRQVVMRSMQRPGELRAAITGGLVQIAEEGAAHVQSDYFTGYKTGVSRSNKLSMVFNRTGSLRQSVAAGKIDDFTTFVGTTQGPAGAYARTILSSETTGIAPKRGKYLWIPIADNLNPSGIAKMTPREAMGIRTLRGKRALRIFKSKAGNVVAFLPGEEIIDTAGKRLGLVRTRIFKGAGRYTRGANKGRTKGKLLFVLKRFVVVEGSGALEHGVMDMGPRGVAILTQRINATNTGKSGGAA